jgi:thiamine pyrophosphate-dependent acetolactate synthase large subunit-like protein
MMNLRDTFAYMVSRWTDELVVTSAGHSSGMWWELTNDRERVFYLTASMSLSSMFAAGIAFGHPGIPLWAFSGDGAFVMNPGMLFVERRMNLPNLTHFLVSNRCYGSTEEVDIPFTEHADYANLARAAGIERVYDFSDLDDFRARFDEAVLTPGHTFIVLNVEKAGKDVRTATMDGPEVKFRFGRHVEAISGQTIFNILP